MTSVRTRFAPSPTGDLHLGGAYVALASWVLARRCAGAFVLRMEDLDLPRVVPGSAERILDDLRWLGLHWDEGPDVGGPHGPYAQSTRTALYEARLTTLADAGLVYPCDCSRAEIARSASAPHAGEEVVYPGHCRDKDPARIGRRPFAARLRVNAVPITAHDEVAGAFTQRLDVDVGDFALRRSDGLFTYQHAVAADDDDMRITHVLRGADLLASTPRQIHLIALWRERWGGTPPSYAHLPLVVDSQGARLEKRSRGMRVRTLREAGIAPERVVGALAYALGLTHAPDPLSARELAETRDLPAWRPESWRIPNAFAELDAEPS